MKIKAIYKKKEMNPKEFRNFIRKTITEQAKSQKLNERYDDDENLGIYSGEFDPNEFGGEAMRAAMQEQAMKQQQALAEARKNQPAATPPKKKK